MALLIPLQRRAPTKVIVFQWPVRNPANQALAAHATTTHPHHFRIGGGLVDEDRRAGSNRPRSPHPAPTRPRHVGALLLRRPQAFLNVMS